MVYTTIRRYRSLTWVLEQFVKKMPKREFLPLPMLPLPEQPDRDALAINDRA